MRSVWWENPAGGAPSSECRDDGCVRRAVRLARDSAGPGLGWPGTRQAAPGVLAASP